MKKSYKMVSYLILGLILSFCIGKSVQAFPYKGGDWVCGNRSIDNNIMGYSYFYHATKLHWAQVRTIGYGNVTEYSGPGKTACANGPTIWEPAAYISLWAGI